MMIQLGTLTQPSFMFLVGLGAVLSMAFVALRHRTFHPNPSFLRVFDVGLVTFASSVLGARVGYILLYDGDWSSGGLSWHITLIIGLLTLLIMSRWRKLDQALLWDSVAWCLPLLLWMAWWGCRGASCGFGREVETLADYPALMVWEGRDLIHALAPRFATQALGMMGAVVIWLILALVAYQRWLVGRWFGFVLMLTGALMFGIGFLRGDPVDVLGSWRVDQLLDLGVILIGAVMCLTRPNGYPPIPQSKA